jgi:hypothetical protein
MICFRDRLFCSARCATVECDRHWNETLAAQARAWWGKDGAPVASADMSVGCIDYKPEAA